MYTNEVKDEESLGGKLYNKKRRTLFLSVAVAVIYICTISFKSYRRGYEVGYNDGYNKMVDRIMDKIKV